MSARLRIGPRWTALVGAGALALAAPVFGLETVTLRHVHGLGYSPDGSRLMIPSHDGLSVYSGGRWSKAPGPKHDFMGFAVTRDFIISSGHPARGAGRANPLGLIRSRDGGRSWTRLDFEGEAEFHVVAAGYANNAVYVHNPAPNSRMPRPGIYRMIGQGPDWRGASGRGLHGEIHTLAVHPAQAELIAAATSAGLFLSRDAGDEFKQVMAGAHATAAHFALEGDSLWFSAFDGKPSLYRVAIGGDAREETALPALERDAVANIAQNPARRAEFAIVTFERAVFLTPDAGTTWTRIAPPRGSAPER
jgi:photosystem II stability/assembly factor-like uncharacterized protein